MSGHKRAIVRLSRQDLQRIEQLASQLRQVEHDYNHINKTIQDQRQNQVEQANIGLQNRLETFSNLVGDFHERLGWIETQTNQAMIDQAYNLQDQILSNQNILVQNTNTLIEQHVNAIHDYLQENQQALKDHFDELRATIRQIQREKDRKNFLAFDALQAAEAILNAINQVYDHERYYPGALNRLSDQYAMAVQNLQNELPEACLSIAQQVSQQASILRMSIEEILQKTTLIQTIAIEKMRELYETIRQNAVVPALDLEGNLLEVEIDVDFWTDGRWTGLLTRCEKFLAQLQTTSDALEYDDIDRILKFVIPQLEQSLHDAVSQARLKVILSQIRFNIAERVLDALSGQGFETKAAIYENEDERQPYQVVVQNLEGSEVHVNIDSTEPLGAYSVQVDSYEAFTGTESEMRQRSIEIFNSLQRLGLVVGQPVEINDEKSNYGVQKTFGNPFQSKHQAVQLISNRSIN